MKQWARALGIFSIIIGEIVGFTAVGVYLGIWLTKSYVLPSFVVFLTGILGFTMALVFILKIADREK